MTKKQLVDALDNSQSLFVMIKHIGPNVNLWKVEDIDDLLAKQIVENRSILSAPQPAGADAVRAAVFQECIDIASGLTDCNVSYVVEKLRDAAQQK